jgi:L,D-transpeptidase YbiS
MMAEQTARSTVVVIRTPAWTLRKRWFFLAGGAAALVALLCAGTGYGYRSAGSRPPGAAASVPADPDAARSMRSALDKEDRALRAKLSRLAPKGNYLVIDQTRNRLYIKKDGEVVREAICSAGSGMVLQTHDGKRKWVFDTPRGVFKVRNRRSNPVWTKPDWAFVEDGLPIPSRRSDRVETGVLGEYALDLEDGYMIHGTLYERLLGRPVSHGCVRLGKEDLRAVWKAAPIGTPVYIY